MIGRRASACIFVIWLSVQVCLGQDLAEAPRAAAWWAQTLVFDSSQQALPYLSAQYEALAQPTQHITPDYPMREEEYLAATQQLLAAMSYHTTLMPAADADFLQRYRYVALYLSNYYPLTRGAYDKAGIWQLSYPVARRYGLRVDQAQDERLDLIKATRAARMHMASLQQKYDSSTAVIVFCEGPLLLHKQGLPGVDSLLAATHKSLTQTHQLCEELPAGSPARASYPTQTVRLETTVHRQDFVNSQGIDESTFLAFNPEITGKELSEGLVVRVPEGVTSPDWDSLALQWSSTLAEQEHFLDSARKALKKGTPDPRNYDVMTYTVRAGDVLGSIAGRWGVSVRNIQKWNNLRGSMIRVGQKLTIYRKKGSKVPVRQAPVAAAQGSPVKTRTQKAPTPAQAPLAEGEYIIYEVQSGDTLWDIARLYEGVSDRDIMRWNGINERIDVGQQLKIKKPSN